MDNTLFFIPDNKSTDLYNFVLDPLSAIIKLAIISNKPVGTKIFIDDHTICFQEPGMFQGFCRLILKTNKTDMQYLYNPIEMACQLYLTEEYVCKYPKLKSLFISAQQGLIKLKETYKNSNIICLCFNYFNILIENYLDRGTSKKLFLRDNMSVFYTDELNATTSKLWNEQKITIVLNLITYISSDTQDDVKSLETIMEGVDRSVRHVL